MCWCHHSRQCSPRLAAAAAVYFWLCYCLMALARISGPHRPDDYYGLSLCLMVIVCWPATPIAGFRTKKRQIRLTLSPRIKFICRFSAFSCQFAAASVPKRSVRA